MSDSCAIVRFALPGRGQHEQHVEYIGGACISSIIAEAVRASKEDGVVVANVLEIYCGDRTIFRSTRDLGLW